MVRGNGKISLEADEDLRIASGICIRCTGRINLAQLLMRKMQGMWGASKVNLALKVWLYDAYIRSILLYNSGTWGVTNYSP